MSEKASSKRDDNQHESAVDIEDIEIFEPANGIASAPVDYKHDTSTLPEGLTIKQASKVLKVSANTVRARIKAGELAACKVKGRRCEEWRVFPGIAPASIQQDTSTLPETLPNNIEMSRLLDIIEAQSTKLEAASGQIGYLQAQLQTSREQMKLLEDRSRVPWWRRFWSWFAGVRV